MLTIWILFTSIALFYWYWKKTYFYWKNQNVPQLRSWPLLGSYITGKKPLQELEQELYNEYGRVYGRYDGNLAVLSVAEPELLKSVFIKDFHLFPNRRDLKFNDNVFDNTLFSLEGESWKRVRNTVTPTFTSAKLKRMLPLMDDCCDIMIENILEMTEEKNEVNLQRIFGAFTIDIIGKCAFGITINSLRSEGDPFVDKAKRLLVCKFNFRTFLAVTCPGIMKSLHISLLNPETTSFYRKVILDVMEERKKKRGRDDFLQLLLDAQNDVQDQNNNNVQHKMEENSLISSISPAVSGSNESINQASFTDSKNVLNKGLSHDELVAQCVTFFMAGYDATTTLLTNAVYNLAMNEHYQETVIDEMKAAIEKHNGIVNYDTLNELKFTEAVLLECMRLCPSMVRNERRVEKDCTLGESNISLKKGMIISIPVYAMHRDPEWFPEPDVFKPERFYDPDESRPQIVHMPFGAGPRICIGQRFVMMQVKLCLTRLLLRFQAQPASITPKNLGITEVRNVLQVKEVDISLVDRSTML